MSKNTQPEISGLDTTTSTILKTEEDYNETYLTVVKEATRNRVEMLRDYTTVAMALLGGGLTVLTVSPQLIKTYILFIFGLMFIVACLIIAFMTRRSISTFYENYLIVVRKRYHNVADAVAGLKSNPNEFSARDRLEKALYEREGFPELSKLGEYGDRYVGVLLIIGGLLSIVALFFTVTF